MTSGPRLRWLDRLEENLIASLMGVATVVIFIAVVHRYALSHLGGLVVWSREEGYSGLSDVLRTFYFGLLSIRLTWAQELCIYLFVWMAKFGAAYGVRTGIHVGVDILVNRLPPAWRHRMVLIGIGCGALFTAIVGWLGARLVMHLFHSGQVSAVMEAARLVPDVLPFPASGPALPADGHAAASRSHDGSHVERGSAVTSILIFGLLILLLLTGTPVSIALGLTVLTALLTLTSVPLDAVALKLFTGMEKFEIMAVPFFILAGAFLTHGGVAKRMIRFATAMTGHWPGGLGIASVLACAIFAAVSGSSPATVIAIGSILVPAMAAQGYPNRFGAGVIASSGTLGILIPPSIVMVLYSLATAGMSAKGPEGQRVSAASVDDLFMAGVVPGLLLAAVLATVTWWIARSEGYPRAERSGWREAGEAFIDCIWGLALIAVVLGGIYGGLVTPTEAASAGPMFRRFCWQRRT